MVVIIITELYNTWINITLSTTYYFQTLYFVTYFVTCLSLLPRALYINHHFIFAGGANRVKRRHSAINSEERLAESPCQNYEKKYSSERLARETACHVDWSRKMHPEQIGEPQRD